VEVGQAGEGLLVELLSELTPQRGHEQAAAHADAAVDLPDGERDADPLERLAPGDHVLVDAVDQRPVEVEQERRVLAAGHA
jgi:hypothetical protein